MQTVPEYSFEDLQTYHDKFTLRTWIEPGEMMRYAFLNTPEFMPHAVITATVRLPSSQKSRETTSQAWSFALRSGQ